MASKFKLVDEKLRLDIKGKADETRYKWTTSLAIALM